MVEPKTELQRNALMRARQQELSSYQRALDMKWLDDRMEDGRIGRLLGLIQRESRMEKEHQERTDHAAFVDSQAIKEAALGYEVAKVRREEINALQRRHYLRERDPELRELVRKLEGGYTCRDIKRQIHDNEHKKLQEKVEEKQVNHLVLSALDNKGTKEKEALERMKREAEYRRELQQQLVNKQRVKQCAYEESLIEKKMLDDIMRTIADEDKRELEQKRQAAERTRHEIKTFKQAQLAWRDKQKVLVLQEQRQIEEQKRQVADRSAALIAERKRVLEAREAMNKVIGAKIKAAEDERLRREDIVRQLHQQEYLEKNIQDDHAQREKTARTKRDNKEALTKQMNTRKQEEELQKARDLELRKQTEAKLALENQKELEKKQGIREKNRRHAAELMQQMETQRAQRTACKRDDEMRYKAVVDYQTSWDKEVAKERREIIQEHAPHLLGYLQAGVIKKDDLPDVRIGANKHEDLAKLDIEGLAHTKRATLFPKCNDQCTVIREY